MREDLSFHHFALSVPDIDAAADWYSTMLDFSIERRFDLPGNIKAMFLQRGALRIELFQVPAPKPLPDERRDPRRDLETLGNKHLSFQTRHSDRLRKRLEDHDVRIILDIGENDEQGFFFHDNNDNVIEVLRSPG